MPHTFSQSEHPFDKCGHFSQVEPFVKPLCFVMNIKIMHLKLKMED
jgi:hypothetical protein